MLSICYRKNKNKKSYSISKLEIEWYTVFWLQLYLSKCTVSEHFVTWLAGPEQFEYNHIPLWRKLKQQLPAFFLILLLKRGTFQKEIRMEKRFGQEWMLFYDASRKGRHFTNPLTTMNRISSLLLVVVMEEPNGFHVPCVSLHDLYGGSLYSAEFQSC